MGASLCPISHLPELSTTSCKAACSLFRYHLHINAARELAEKHLMWRYQFLQIFVILHSHPLSNIWPPCHKVPLKQYQREYGCFKPPRTNVPRWLFTSDRFMSIINNFQLFQQCNFHFYLSRPSSDMSASSD